MSQFFTLPTKIGQGLMSNAIAYNEPLTIATMAIGDGGGTLPSPDASVTRLVNEVRRGPINQITTDPDNPNWVIAEQVLPPDVGGWTIREVGLYDTDGNLIAYGNYPETYKPQLSEGSSRTQTIRFVMEVTDTSAVTLKIDPSVVMSSRQYVDDSIEAHAKSRNHPYADTTNQDMVKFATLTAAKTGTDSKTALTPAAAWPSSMITGQRKKHTMLARSRLMPCCRCLVRTVQGALAALGSASRLGVATQEQVDEITDDTVVVTPKKLAFGIAYSSKVNGYLRLPRWLGAFIFQWGYVSASAVKSIAWPIAFEQSVYAYSGIGADEDGVTCAHCMYGTTLTGAQINNTRALRWIAIGK